MSYFFRHIAAIIAVALPLLALAGCGDKSTDPPADNSVLVKPKSGSVWIYRTTRYDTNGTQTSVRSDTFSVVNDNMAVWGVSGLVGIYSTVAGDSGYARYEPNGDLSIFDPTDLDHDGTKDGMRVQLFPLTSHTATQTDIDTGYDSGSNYTVHRDSIVYDGEVTITLPAGTFTAAKVRDVMDHRAFTGSGTQYDHNREIATYYISRKTGFIAKWTWEHEYLDNGGSLKKRYVFTNMELSSYTLK